MAKESKAMVLIVEDQPNWREIFSDLLADKYEIISVGSYNEALRALERDPPFDVAVVDIRLDDKDQANEEGLCLIEQINNRGDPTNTIVVTGYPTIRTARKALRNLNAFDYIEKYPEDGTSFDVVGFLQIVSKAAESSVGNPPDRLMQEVSAVEDDPRQQETLSTAARTMKSIVRLGSVRQWKEIGIAP